MVHQPRVRLRRSAARLGTVHPLAQPGRREQPVPPARRFVARRAEDSLAPVDRVTAGRRRPRRRRQERGDRSAQRRARRTVRHAGIRLHGPRRRPARRRALGDAPRGLRQPPALVEAGVSPGRRLVLAERDPAPTVANISGDARPEIVAAVPDGSVYAIGPTGKRLWRFDYAHGAPKSFASEVVAAT